ncbi:HlyD family secretion protein [Tenacibaculum jejuense]|uniref:HlyD-family transporter n=1 Tax=Tenacibaculum jejuense TaxID=584609 RepID=A0A238U6Q8_9FLAO|nr:HlyD family secretion protein [Tenacibaculum jejuense]SNR14278.1 HlyD-family transporter [Tenacibaculum jejuense]
MPQNSQDTEIRSEEVQEILNKVPSWMIRYGNMLILLLIIILLFISWFVKYPDVIKTQVMVTTAIPPEKIYAKNSGKFEVLLANEGTEVKEGEVLAVIKNSASYKDVLFLKSVVDTIEFHNEEFNFPLDDIPVLNLGDINSSFSQFENDYQEYLLNKDLAPFKSQVIASQVSVIEAKRRLQNMLYQKELSKKELEFKKTDLKRSTQMFEKGVISAKEMEQREVEFIQAERGYANMEASILQIRELINSSSQNLDDTSIKKTQNDKSLQKRAKQSFLLLKKAISDWENNYALTTSISGKVSFLSFWSKNQNVKTGDLIFTIVPSDAENFVGKIKAPIANSGKIKIGQQVQIKLLNYPSDEFGKLDGTIQRISVIADEEGNYYIDVDLPNKLQTSYNKQLEFRQEMQGNADIITEDLRLIERFFYQLKKVIK